MSWEYNDKEHIKLFRKIINWEWYTDVNTTKLFLHCLLKANWKDGNWRGYKYERGQFITSIGTLAKETGLTQKQVRVALDHLIRTGEVASKNYPKFRVITVNSYAEYQDRGKQKGNETASKRAAKGQAKGKQRATDIRSKEYKEDKEYIKPSSGVDDEPGEPWPDDFFD